MIGSNKIEDYNNLFDIDRLKFIEKFFNKIGVEGYTAKNFSKESGVDLNIDCKNYQYYSTINCKEFNLFIEFYSEKLFSGSISNKNLKALKVFLSNAVYSIQNGFLVIRYSRDKSLYHEMKGINAWTSYTSTVKIVDYFKDNGYILHFNGYNKKNGNKEKDYQSRFMPSCKLVQELLDISGSISSELYPLIEDKSNQPLIVFKKPKVDNKKESFVVLNPPEQLIRMGSQIQKINEAYKKHLIEPDFGEEGWKYIRKNVSANIDYSNIKFKRIFNNCVEGTSANELTKYGGRFYDHICATPSEYRKLLKFNGNSTVELDFSSFHPTLIYAKYLGIECSSDPYTVDYDYEKFFERTNCHLRTVLKCIMTFMLNVDIERQKKGLHKIVYDKIIDELSEHYYYKKKYVPVESKGKVVVSRAVEKPDGITKETVNELYELLKDKHQQIFHLMDGKLGLLALKLESDICFEILKHFILKRKICILPVHDSFIIEKQHADELKDVMIKSFQKITGTNIVPKIK